MSNSDIENDNQDSSKPEQPAATPAGGQKPFSFSATYSQQANRLSSSSSLLQNFNFNASNLPSDGPPSSFSVVRTDDFQTSDFAGKPNAIVRPIRRSDHTSTYSNSYALNKENYPQFEATGVSLNRPGHGGASYDKTTTHSFVDELNQKLNRILQRDYDVSPRSSHYRSFSSHDHPAAEDPLSNRPLFITTVPTGIYLPPSSEANLPTYLSRRVYAYSTEPIIFGDYYKNLSQTYGQSLLSHNRKLAAAAAATAAANANTTTIGYTNTLKTTSNTFLRTSYNLPKDNRTKPNIYTTNTNTNASNKNNNSNSKNVATINNATTSTNFSNLTSNKSTSHVSKSDKEITTRIVKATATATATTTATKAPTTTTNPYEIGSSKGQHFSNLASASKALLGGVHITKEQFKQHVQQQRSKREANCQPATGTNIAAANQAYKNIMYDKRVHRGSNFGSQQCVVDSDAYDKAAFHRRRQALRNRNINQRNQRNVLGTPPPVAGRKHELIQTDKYLEELVRKVPEKSVNTQTDLFLERLPTPPYTPSPRRQIQSSDASTEVKESDLEMSSGTTKPFIDSLVNRCVENSLFEIHQTKDLDELQSKKSE